MSEEIPLLPLPIGTVLNNRFQLQKAFAAGGFSLVYRAVDVSTAEVVIIKECAPTGMVYRDEAQNIQLVNPQNATSFQRIVDNTVEEANLLYTLTTQGVTGITRYIDGFHAYNTFFVVMSEARGFDLHTWTETFRSKGAGFPPDLLQKTLTSILVILGQIHAAGYFHCDIKPANILIDESGEVTIIDLGAARSPQKQHDDTVAISPGFSPPEFYPGNRGQIGAWTDIYMLGAMIYNMITGKVPPPADERLGRDLFVQICSMTDLLKYYPEALLASVDKAMEIDAKERFHSTETWRTFYDRRKAAPKIHRAHEKQKHNPVFGVNDLSTKRATKTSSGMSNVTFFIILITMIAATVYICRL
ncbi:MAG: serine/threonine-protein kinase [Akkermansia sp.]